LKYKIAVTLTYDGIPLDGAILIFIDKNYLKTLYTVNGYAEDIIDVEGKKIYAYYEGTDDYDEAYAEASLVPPPPPLPPLAPLMGLWAFFLSAKEFLREEEKQVTPSMSKRIANLIKKCSYYKQLRKKQVSKG
jgi:hypothetical protein